MNQASRETIVLVRPFTDATIGNSPPLALMYLSSYLKARGVSVSLLDNCVDRRSIHEFSLKNREVADLVRRICDLKPTVVGMTLFSRELREISALCRLLKLEMPSVRILLGGPHPTAMAQETLEQIPECDLVIRGESEVVLCELMAALSRGDDLAGVKGLSARADGHITHAEPADILLDLDSLPFPDRESVLANYRNGKYGSLIYGSPSDIVMTSRGCPFQCGFCFKVCSRYRARSPENVLAEIDWVVPHIRPQYIQVMDDSFTINRRRCERILDGLIERQYPCRFKVRSRVNAVDEDLLRKMKRARVDTIVFGLESGSQMMLDAFSKKTTVQDNIRACRLARRAGIACLGDMILFYPGETRRTLKETKRFVQMARPTAVKYFVLTPLPKTRVYEESKRNGTLRGDWNLGSETPWVKLDEFKDLTEMEGIAKRMQLGSMLSLRSIFSILRYYGFSLLRNPSLAMRLIAHSLLKKRKY